MSADLKESSAPLAEISHKPNGFEEFLDRNHKAIAVFAVLLVIAAIALVISRGIETSRQEAAGAALLKADNSAAYQAVVDEHAGTTAGGSAMVLLAETQWEENKKDESIATLRDFIAAYSGHAALPSAKASLGAKLMAQGKTGDASAVFEEVAADPAGRYIAPYALVSLGDIAKADGDHEKARAAYIKVTTEFSTSSFADTASRRLAILDTQAPVEVDAPPATEFAPGAGDNDIPAFTLPGMTDALTPPPAVEETPQELTPEIPADSSEQEEEEDPAPASESTDQPPAAPNP
jgi:predicted negative regulator of RcsB-dependent stress response